jgi:replicative DNA helicase
MARAKPKDKQTEPSYLKVPPQNLEAEQAILGAILIHNDAMNQVVDVVTPEDFYREAHAAIFEGMVSLYHQGDPIDIITIAQFLTRKGFLENIGGAEYLASLVEAVSTSAGIGHYAEMVKDNAIRRKLIGQCSTISDACFQPWENTDDLLDQAEQSIFDIAEQRVREGFDPLKEVIKTSFAKLEAVASREGHITGVPTDFRDFDRLTAGLQPSDLIIIAGRPRRRWRSFHWRCPSSSSASGFWVLTRASMPPSCGAVSCATMTGGNCSTPPIGSRSCPSSSMTARASACWR